MTTNGLPGLPDRLTMIGFIASQLPNGEATLALGDHTSVEVSVCGMDLILPSDRPEWVTVREVYNYLHWQALPSWEQLRTLRAKAVPSPASQLQKRLDAYKATDTRAPYRFERVGDMYVVHFRDNVDLTVRYFKSRRGFEYYARLLAQPGKRMLSIDLSGDSHLLTSGLAAADTATSRHLLHDKDALTSYRKCIATLDDKYEAAKLAGNLKQMEEIEQQQAELKRVLKLNDKDTSLYRLGRQKLGKRTLPEQLHSTVGQAMRRALKELRQQGMRQCADHLKRYVLPEDGESFTYQPPFPVEWVL